MTAEQVIGDQLLAAGELAIVGRLVDASNASLLATVTVDGRAVPCVYKPVAGERPLWDFPSGTLARREVAAYRLSAISGLSVVPPTVLRDGPLGPGSVQRWAGGLEAAEMEEAEPGAGLIDVLPEGDVPPGWLAVLRAQDPQGRPVVLAHADDPALRRMAVFDALANNADRKGGHVLRDPSSGAVLGVDHGLTFNVDPKLRTVLWGWAGQPLAEPELDTCRRVAADLAGDTALHRQLAELLAPEEVARTAQRAVRLVSQGRYPQPGEGWPAIPWPAF